ncbi:unnamed protein product, partial [Rotaria socialis]
LAAIVARVVFTAAAKISPHPGRGRTAGNGRKAQESAGEWKQYSSWKLPDFFLVDSDQLPDIRPHHSPSPPTLNSSTSSNNTKVRLARNPVLSIQHPKTSTPCQQKSSFHNPKFNHPPPPISSSPPTPRTSSIAPTTAAIVIMKTLCLFYHFHDIFLFNCTNSLNE